MKQLLGDVLSGNARKPPAQAALFAVPDPAPVVSDTKLNPHPDNAKAAFMLLEEKAVLMQEVDSLLSQGLSGGDVARKFNAEGRRTIRGAAFTGRNVIRDWRKWKGEVG